MSKNEDIFLAVKAFDCSYSLMFLIASAMAKRVLTTTHAQCDVR